MRRFGVEPSWYVCLGVLIPHTDLFNSLLVLAHNHPNGVVSPTAHDKALTRAIVLAAETVSVRVLDQLVVSAHESFSFRRAGLL